jgi:hypothetical protein
VIVLEWHGVCRLQACKIVSTRRRATLYVIIGYDAPDAKETRPQQRPAHLRHLEPLAAAGKIVLAGPFTDGTGSLIVVEAESREEVWAMVSRDPYVVNGVFNRVEVRPFKQVFPEGSS